MRAGVADRGMDERENAADIVLAEPERRKALHRFQAQLKKWRLVMPAHEPLVLDFGLADFHKTGLIEYWIANEAKAGYCGKFLFVFDGQACPLHWHRHKHETFFIVRGKVEMSFDGSMRTMVAGDCLAVAPRIRHGFTGKGPALLLEVSKPCVVQDNFFQDRAIPIGGNCRKRPGKPTRHVKPKAECPTRRGRS
jgi:mannose-6-phosphate isomerase-like protein (cupin superfamily)